MSTPGVMLAHAWDGEKDLSGWLLSEKLDGVRALWIPEERRFVSRNGKPLNAPGWFVKDLPDIALDGELFVGRGMFQDVVGTVRKKVPLDEEWSKVTYCVFDQPRHPGTFADRICSLQAMSDDYGLGAYAVTVPHLDCEGNEDMVRVLTDVLALGAEGLMAKHPDSMYEDGRSHNLLKIKKFHDDEAKVVGYEDGKGKHKGRVGALVCVRPDGVQFKIGTGLTDHQRENPPAIEATVTYRYFELTKDGVPRFPSFLSVRDYE